MATLYGYRILVVYRIGVVLSNHKKITVVVPKDYNLAVAQIKLSERTRPLDGYPGVKVVI